VIFSMPINYKNEFNCMSDIKLFQLQGGNVSELTGSADASKSFLRFAISSKSIYNSGKR